MAVEPQRPRGIVSLTFFASDAVKRLTSSDFALASKEKIAIVWADCMIVLFYGENRESRHLMEIFLVAAEQAAGPEFASCNLIAEKDVARAFVEIESDGHPFYWARSRGYPFILAYRKGWPTAFYNGDRSVGALVDFAQTKACESSYFERNQLAAGVQSESNLEMPPIDPYGYDPKKNPERKSSLYYRTDSPIRGYNPEFGVFPPGSPAGERASETLRAAEASRDQRGGVLYPTADTGPRRPAPPLEPVPLAAPIRRQT